MHPALDEQYTNLEQSFSHVRQPHKPTPLLIFGVVVAKPISVRSRYQTLLYSIGLINCLGCTARRPPGSKRPGLLVVRGKASADDETTAIHPDVETTQTPTSKTLSVTLVKRCIRAKHP